MRTRTKQEGKNVERISKHIRISWKFSGDIFGVTNSLIFIASTTTITSKSSKGQPSNYRFIHEMFKLKL